jgi:signal transduction histidine kinase
MRGEQFKLVSLTNIRSELEETEMEAWQKMIRILTHEIMNSITPISSLASTLTDMINTSQSSLSQESETSLDHESIEDIRKALKTIHKRSKGLLNFVGAYRNLTLIPKPQFEFFSIKELFSRIERLMKPRFEEEGIFFDSKVEPQSLELTADPELIEQVILNLLLNAIDGVKGTVKPEIKLTAGMGDRGQTWIEVCDNGRGIMPEALEKIFIPFFTTKKNGSGIGLSLARQIMRLHGGTINSESNVDQGAIFRLGF